MTIEPPHPMKEIAATLDGHEYGDEVTRETEAFLKVNGIVVVFGASDDLCEFRGAISDEVDCYGGRQILLHKVTGLLANECNAADCPHHAREIEAALAAGAWIEAVWDAEGFSWIYLTKIPHETFVIKEDGTNYCRGIVFRLADVP